MKCYLIPGVFPGEGHHFQLDFSVKNIFTIIVLLISVLKLNAPAFPFLFFGFLLFIDVLRYLFTCCSFFWPVFIYCI